MGTISQLHARTRPIAHRIQSEEEALEVARALAADFMPRASDRDINRLLPHDELDALSQSGLLGISVPSEYGGLDVSNSILADVAATLAEADPSVGQIPQVHFHILEALRNDGSEEQRKFFFERALTGDRFVTAVSEPGNDDTRIAPDGLGYRITGRMHHSTGILFADWIAVIAPDPGGRTVISFLSRDAEGIQAIDDWDGFGQRTTGSGTITLNNVYANADAVLHRDAGSQRLTTVGLVGEIIHAGIDLGIARAAFREALDFVKSKAQPLTRSGVGSGIERAADDPLILSRIGEIAIRLETAAAIVERAGKKIDIGQIDPKEANLIDAMLSVAAAKVLTGEIALEASNTLFELAGISATRIGLNLDRHWRNARTHTLLNPLPRMYYEIGNYHLNRVTPPEGSIF
ncbi:MULTISPECIES: SfnB family sulfur acquisition oxidoreductase [unclassified Sinorhizobium]|uniref:SfnB family sulfur acquisition oxidoreductase n=1 Tax=unclassified Sinorhizobium TaxID=2613772 RepID=UPI003523A327